MFHCIIAEATIYKPNVIAMPDSTCHRGRPQVERLICTHAALSQTILTLPRDLQQTGYLMTLWDLVNGGT